ncbi:hypothetical protein QAD02_016361 [Eretmocerus hayati]|uniref:Uncharacterized protein n=1 Tax=Eretmocerus hayati TaxID=131215 RepID=A0ACC2PAC6_9HYME|nr:hypothetical protein QAD02_016361 [Eretmocerus hayati]
MNKWAIVEQLPHEAKRMVFLPQKKAEASGSGSLTIPIPGGSDSGGSHGADGGAVTPGGFSNGEGTEEFLSTGRTGRRNAMPDILGQNAQTGTADLPDKLEALTTDPSGPRSQPEPGPSSQQQAG